MSSETGLTGIVMREDIQTLKDDWLTDNVISFWEEYVISPPIS